MGPEHTPRSSNGAGWSDLLDRYYAGECNADERAVVENELVAQPRVVSFFRLLRQLLNSEPAETFDVRAGLQRVKHQGGAVRPGLWVEGEGARSRKGGAQPRELRTGSFKTQPLPRIAHSALVTLGIALTIFAGWHLERRHHSVRAKPSMLAYTTTNGQQATITLPDGGTVALNVASRLEIPMDYMAGNHTVRLIGEGLFTVPRHQGVPFTVVAGTTTARVLGTSFVVRRYPTDTTTLVAVRDGKVAVGTIVVTASRLLEVGPGGATSLRAGDETPFAFAAGVLVLPTMSLAQAVPELDRWYAVHIRVGDPSLAPIPIKGRFIAGSVSDLVESLAFMLDARIVRAGRTLTLYQKAR